MKKLMKTLLGVVALVALLASCKNTLEPQLVQFDLAKPAVTGTSKFGANLLEWKDVEHARYYRIYRKAGEEEEKLLAVVAPGKEYYADFIATTNVLKEGTTYTYRVVAARNQYRKAIIEGFYDEDDSWKSAETTVDITVAAGNAPAYATAAPKPTTAKATTFTTTKNMRSRVVIEQDTLADGKTMSTDGWAISQAYSVEGYVFQFGWNGGAFDIPYPGKYDIYGYNYVKGGNYYQSSGDVKLATVEITNEAKNKNYINSFEATENNDGTITLNYTINSNCETEGVSYKLVRGKAEQYPTRYGSTNEEVVGITEITEVDLKDVESYTQYNQMWGSTTAKSTTYYTIVDKDEKLKSGNTYVYFLQAFVGDERMASWYSTAVCEKWESDYCLSFYANREDNKIQLSWSFSEDYGKDGITYKIYRQSNGVSVKELTLTPEHEVISYNYTDGSRYYADSYVAYDADVEDGINYTYYIDLYKGNNLVYRTRTNQLALTIFNSNWSNWDTVAKQPEYDSTTHKLTKTELYSTAEFENTWYDGNYSNGSSDSWYGIPSKATVTVTRAKFTTAAGWEDPVVIKANVSELPKPSTEGVSYYYIDYKEEDLKTLVEDGETTETPRYKYEITFATEKGIIVFNKTQIWGWASSNAEPPATTSNWFEAQYKNDTATTKDTIKIPVKLRGMTRTGTADATVDTKVDVSKYTVKFLIETDGDILASDGTVTLFRDSVYSIKTFTGFTADTEKVCEITGLKKDTEYTISMAVYDADGNAVYTKYAPYGASYGYEQYSSEIGTFTTAAE